MDESFTHSDVDESQISIFRFNNSFQAFIVYVVCINKIFYSTVMNHMYTQWRSDRESKTSGCGREEDEQGRPSQRGDERGGDGAGLSTVSIAPALRADQMPLSLPSRKQRRWRGGGCGWHR